MALLLAHGQLVQVKPRVMDNWVGEKNMMAYLLLNLMVFQDLIPPKKTVLRNSIILVKLSPIQLLFPVAIQKPISELLSLIWMPKVFHPGMNITGGSLTWLQIRTWVTK